MPDLSLRRMPGKYSIYCLSPDRPLDFSGLCAAHPEALVSAVCTGDELSVVAPSGLARKIGAGREQAGFVLLGVEGVLDFALTGVLARLAQPLARAGVSIFALSTFDTDYLLLPRVDLDRGVAALEDAGHLVREDAESRSGGS